MARSAIVRSAAFRLARDFVKASPQIAYINRIVNNATCSKPPYFVLPLLVTVATAGVRIFVAVTFHATIHRGYLGHLGQRVHLGNLPVTGFALDPSFQMGAMVPENKGRDSVDASPRDRLLGLRKFRQLLDRRFVLSNRGVTGHAARGDGQRHVIAGVGIGMAFRALERGGRVRLVAEWKRLRGRLRLSCLLRERTDRGE